MAKKHATRRRKTTTQKKQPAITRQRLLVSSCIIVLFVSSLTIIRLYGPNQSQLNPKTDNTATEHAQSKTNIHYEFYDLLPQMEVKVPNELQSAPKLIEPNKPYVIQIAAFRDYQDADALKARLLLLGFTVDIQSVKQNNGRTWHRVRTAQYADKKSAERDRQRLQEFDINGLLLEATG